MDEVDQVQQQLAEFGDACAAADLEETVAQWDSRLHPRDNRGMFTDQALARRPSGHNDPMQPPLSTYSPLPVGTPVKIARGAQLEGTNMATGNPKRARGRGRVARHSIGGYRGPITEVEWANGVTTFHTGDPSADSRLIVD